MGLTRRNDAHVMKRRRERRRPDRRLEFFELEPRMLLAPVYIPPADRSDGKLIAPPVIESVNGVLKAYVNVVQAGYPAGGSPSVLYGGKPAFSNPDAPPDIPGPNPGPAPHFPLLITMGYQFTTADGTVYPAQYPGPTLHVQPGDILDAPEVPDGARVVDRTSTAGGENHDSDDR